MDDPVQVENSLILSIRTKSYNFLFLKNQILRYQFATLFWALPIYLSSTFFYFHFYICSFSFDLKQYSSCYDSGCIEPSLPGLLVVGVLLVILGLGSHLLVYKQR